MSKVEEPKVDLLRRQDDKIMANVTIDIRTMKIDIKDIKKQQSTISDKVDKINNTLDGDKEHYIDGIVDKVHRLEKNDKWVSEIRSNMKFLWFLATLLGINTLQTLIPLLVKLAAAIKVMAKF